MLTKRIIACLDMDDGRVVKGVQFVNLRDAGDPAECAAAHARDGADEIVLLDITATSDKRKPCSTLSRARRAVCLFRSRSAEEFANSPMPRPCSRQAPTRSPINSAAVKDPTLIGKIAARFGSQAVVVAIDARRVNGGLGGFEVFVAGGRTPTGRDAILWAREAAACGAGEIMLTSMDRDGTQAGFDCELTQLVADAVSIPVIASGGAGSPRDFIEVFQSGRADAALAASIFHFGIENIGQLKRELQAANVPVRWPC